MALPDIEKQYREAVGMWGKRLWMARLWWEVVKRRHRSSEQASSCRSPRCSSPPLEPSSSPHYLCLRLQSIPKSPFNSTAVAGRVAFITGGGSGIGFEIARQLGLHGAAVCLMGRREEVLVKATKRLEGEGVRCSFVRGDVREYEKMEVR